MNSKPRIAFCFSGQVRTLDQTYTLFQKNLFDAAKSQGFEYDVFCAVEDDEDVNKVNILHPTKVKKIKSSEVEKIIEEKYGYFINNNLLKDYGYTGFDGHMKVLQQFYKIQKSIKLKQEHEKKKNFIYDVVFRLRFDCAFLRALNFENIYNEIQNKGNLVICNKNRLLPAYKLIIKLEDFYFIMDSKISDILGNIFDNRTECFIGNEIKNKKLSQTLNNIHYHTNNFWLGLVLVHIYSLLFGYFGAENLFFNYYAVNKIAVKRTYISIGWFRNKDNKKYKLFDFRTHSYSKIYLYKKSVYEL